MNQNIDSVSEALRNSENRGEASPEVCSRVLANIGKEAGEQSKIRPFEVYFSFACFLQRGATSPRTPGNNKLSFGNATGTVDIIRRACRTEKITVRQFARGLKSQIADTMMALGDPEGNLVFFPFHDEIGVEKYYARKGGLG